MFKIDFKRLAAIMLPISLRRPLVFGLLRAGLVGVERVYKEFKEARKGHNFRLTHNGQVCYLRGMLHCKYPLIPTLWMIFEDSTFAFRSGDKHRSRRIYGK